MDADAPREQFELLLQAEVQGTLPPFLFFWRHVPGGHDPGPWVLSQWWPAGFEIGGVAYANSEAYMMAEKARLFGDEDVRARILKSNHPADAKKLGRLVRGFYSSLWEAKRYEIVVSGNLAKFSQHDDLRRYLLSTAPQVLVEASPTDRIWGIGLAADDGGAVRPSEWRGLNLLGFALQAVRHRLSLAQPA